MLSLTIALPKGRILDETLPLLARAGVAPTENPETSRKLIIGSNRPEVRFVIVRPSDVPTYVEYGAADLGVAGKDVLLEQGRDQVRDDRARALRRQGHARRSDPPLRIDGARTARGSRGRHRRPRQHRQYPQGQRSGRRRGDPA